jgi:hypothetical protein
LTLVVNPNMHRSAPRPTQWQPTEKANAMNRTPPYGTGPALGHPLNAGIDSKPTTRCQPRRRGLRTPRAAGDHFGQSINLLRRQAQQCMHPIAKHFIADMADEIATHQDKLVRA